MGKIIKNLKIPVISVIIPCYNSGEYLTDAIKSVEEHPNKDLYEIVIVNDGSTDKITLHLLHELKSKSYQVINQENKGPAAARNFGVKNSIGKYLLFLDSDNLIRTEYIDKGIEILDKYNDIGVVYGNPNFFGENTGTYFFPQEFSLKKILQSNYIDTCAVVRKIVWEEVGGFDENRVLTQEDWDFWIRIGKTHWKFYYINEVLFDYRRRKGSQAMNSLKELEYKQLLQYVYTKHIDIFLDNYFEMKNELEKYRLAIKMPIRTILKFMYKKI